jgi:hypothetical protein
MKFQINRWEMRRDQQTISYNSRRSEMKSQISRRQREKRGTQLRVQVSKEYWQENKKRSEKILMSMRIHVGF